MNFNGRESKDGGEWKGKVKEKKGRKEKRVHKKNRKVGTALNEVKLARKKRESSSIDF